MFKSCNEAITLGEASRMMHMEHPAIDASLRGFVMSGILSLDGENRYRYSATNALSYSIDETARMYSERKIAVINYIYTPVLHPQDRSRID